MFTRTPRARGVAARLAGVVLASLALPLSAAAQISVIGVPPVRWSLNDEAIGVAGSVVEDFEDAALAPGLSILWQSAAGSVGPVTTLPALFNPSTNDAFGNAFVGGNWDGARGLCTGRGNVSYSYAQSQNWGNVTFFFSPPVREVGLSIQQSNAAANLVVNGINRGDVGGLSGLNMTSGGRNGYLIVRAPGAELISSIQIDNRGTGDGYLIDHLTFNATLPDPVTVSGVSPAAWGSPDSVLGVEGAFIENFEDTQLIPDLLVECETPAGNLGPTNVLPRTWNPITQDPNGDLFDPAAWDGSHCFVNTRTNGSFPYNEVADWGDMILRFQRPMALVGFSLEEMALPARLIINGRDAGDLMSRAGLSLAGGGRQGYIRIEAGSTAFISSVRIANGRGSFYDGFAIDHVALSPFCPADFNRDGGVDGADVDAFFAVWEAGDARADVNNDGGVDGADVDYFFGQWETGGCV